MATYPGGVYSPSVKSNGDTIQASWFNDPDGEIAAVETALTTDGLAHNLLPDATANGRTLGATSKSWGLSYLAGVNLKAATTLTLASGAVTATQGYHALDTESAAATDDLDTITAGSGVQEGALLILRAANVARVVTVKDGTGNLLLDGDYALSATDRTLTLLYDGTNWRELSRSVVTQTTPITVTESTWTPAISFGGATTGITYTTQTGHYTKIGLSVWFTGLITLSSNGSASGAFKITGLPVANGDNVNRAATVVGVANFSSLTGALVAYVDNSATSITVLQTSATGTTGVSESNVADTATIQISGWYRAAS